MYWKRLKQLKYKYIRIHRFKKNLDFEYAYFE